MTEKTNAMNPGQMHRAAAVQMMREAVELLGRGLAIMRGEKKNDT